MNDRGRQHTASRRRERIAAFLGLCTLIPVLLHGRQGDANPWYCGTEPGPFRAGFRLETSEDGTRTYGSGGACRTVRMYVWYPSSMRGDPNRMRFRGYADLAVEDFGPRHGWEGTGWQHRYSELPFARSLTEEALRAVLDGTVMAGRDLVPASGDFPILVFGQGLYYESPVTHAFLCEYLASHGYVVATCPLVGSGSRWVRLSVPDLEAQVRDLEFVLSRVRALGYGDPDRIGVAGFDLGGMAGLVMTMRNSGVDAFLSLDCGILYDHGSGLPAIMPDYAVGRFNVPWMHMVSRGHYDATRGDGSVPSLFEMKNVSRNYLLIFEGAQHADFTSYSLIDGRGPVPTYWGPVRGDARKRYAALCLYAKNFLDAHLRDDRDGLAFLKKKTSEAFPDVPLEITVKDGKDRARLEADTWLDTIFRDGIERAVEIAGELRENASGSELLEEAVLNRLGYKFLYNWADAPVAVEIFKLNAAFHPESANVYDSLAEAYLVRGDREKAVANYRLSLERDPGNDNAKRQLESLGVR